MRSNHGRGETSTGIKGPLDVQIQLSVIHNGKASHRQKGRGRPHGPARVLGREQSSNVSEMIQAHHSHGRVQKGNNVIIKLVLKKGGQRLAGKQQKCCRINETNGGIKLDQGPLVRRRRRRRGRLSSTSTWSGRSNEL